MAHWSLHVGSIGPDVRFTSSSVQIWIGRPLALVTYKGLTLGPLRDRLDSGALKGLYCHVDSRLAACGRRRANRKLAAVRLRGMSGRWALARVGGPAIANSKRYRYQVMTPNSSFLVADDPPEPPERKRYGVIAGKCVTRHQELDYGGSLSRRPTEGLSRAEGAGNF